MVYPRSSECESAYGLELVRASMFESMYWPVSASVSASGSESGWKSVCPRSSAFGLAYGWECPSVYASRCGSEFAKASMFESTCWPVSASASW